MWHGISTKHQNMDNDYTLHSGDASLSYVGVMSIGWNMFIVYCLIWRVLVNDASMWVWVCMCACVCVNVFLSLGQCKNVCASAYYRSSWSRPKEKRVLCVLCMPTPFCEAEFRNEGFDIRTIILVVVAVVEWKTNVNVVVARETSIHKHRTHVW